MKTRGMPSPALTEEDVRRIVREEVDISAEAILGSCATHINNLFAHIVDEQKQAQIAVIEACGYKVIKLPGTATELPEEEASIQDAQEGDMYQGVERRKRPEPRQYKAPK